MGEVLRQSFSFQVLNAVFTLASRILATLLTAYFYMAGDRIWFALMATVLIISTSYDMLLEYGRNPTRRWKLLMCVLCILQLGPFTNSFQTLAYVRYREPYRNDNFEMLRSRRSQLFLGNTIQSLPTAAILFYVLVLDLDNRINENLLAVALLISVISFSLGITLFVAGDDPTPLSGFFVFAHVLSQFCLRTYAVCLVCVAFVKWGLVAVIASAIIVYLFGPQGTASIWWSILRCRIDRNINPFTSLAKIYLVPFSFFVILRPEAKGHIPNKPVYIGDCFEDTKFLYFRLAENVGMIVAFLVLPKVRDSFEMWVHWPRVVIAVAFVCVLFAWITWEWTMRVRDVQQVYHLKRLNQPNV